MNLLDRIDLYLNEIKTDDSVAYKKGDLTDKYKEIMSDMNSKLNKTPIKKKRKLIGSYDTILGSEKSSGGY